MTDEEEDENGNTTTGYSHYNNPSETTFTVSLFGHELSFLQEPSNTSIGHGSVVWEAAVIFAKYVELSRDFSISKIQGMKVLELGAGTCLAGTSLMLLGAKLTFTDLPSVCEVITQPNATRIYNKLSSLSLPIQIIPPLVVSLDWIDPKRFADLDAAERTQTSPPPSHYDVILLTDCVFCELLIPSLVDTITSLSSKLTVVYAVHEIRNADANNLFVAAMKERFHKVKIVSKRELAEEYRHELVQVLVAKRLR